MNKRGQNVVKVWAWMLFAIALLIGGGLGAVYLSSVFSEKIKKAMDQGTIPIDEAVGSTGNSYFDGLLRVVTYIVGKVPKSLLDDTGKVGSVIIVVSIWFLILLTFGDIITTFSSFQKVTSAFVAFFLAIIAANIGATVNIIIFFTTLFIGLGLVGIFIGLVAAIAVFVLVNLGVTQLGPWVMERRALIEGARHSASTKKGAQETKDVIEGLRKAGKGFTKPI